jgi:malonyl-CoA O-methyltransferase
MPPGNGLIPLAVLFRAGNRWNETRWSHTAQRAANQLRRTHEVCRWNMPTHLLAAVVEAMLDLDWADEAQRTLALPATSQGARGEIPALADVHWISSAGLARLAWCWYRTGEVERAHAALAALNRRQAADGGFPGSWGRGAAYHPQRQTVATACFALQAAMRQVEASFARGIAGHEHEISPDDKRLLAVRQFLEGLPAGSRIADVGCGSGRYLKRLRAWLPQHRWVGIDASGRALEHLAEGIERLRGSILNLPIEDGRFDAVYCVEALEHSLLPAQAIAELCRVTRPGGRVLVIDKHRRYQPLSEHQPWEIWFAPDEVSRWMQAWCEEVIATPIAQGQQRAAAGLFLCWAGRRQRLPSARAA